MGPKGAKGAGRGRGHVTGQPPRGGGAGGGGGGGDAAEGVWRRHQGVATKVWSRRRVTAASPAVLRDVEQQRARDVLEYLNFVAVEGDDLGDTDAPLRGHRKRRR
eukprot:gene7002-682_t